MFKEINWTVRFNNPLFLWQLVLSVFMPILAYFGFQWEDMTTWASILDLLIKAVQNPVVVVSVCVSVFNCITDPTTKGIGDSDRAKRYVVPRKSNK